MSLLALGLNHRTAPVEIRERVAFAPDKVSQALHELTNYGPVREAAILSTCNRTEIYCGLEGEEKGPILEWFRDFHHLSAKEVEPYLYTHPDSQAVRHILRVASGLDSLVLGEPQILGQIKQAYGTAQQAGTVGHLLNKLFQYTFSVAKQVRTDTAIGASPVSVAFAAVSLAKQIFSDLKEHTALLIGAGETIELVARHLHEQGIGNIIIANRTVERGHKLAQEFGAFAIALAEIPAHLAEADIVISSTAAPLPILGKGMVESALKVRKRRPMLLVDIAVPRDIEAEVSALDDIYLYTVDDLSEIIQENLQSRQQAALQAEDIIDTQVGHFMGWLQSLEAVGTICAFRQSAEEIRDQVLEHCTRQLATGKDPEYVMREMARLLTNKLIHEPSAQLNRASFEGQHELLDAASILFNLKKP
ncbi:MAG: glutamyl-tRNA reductase [Thiohalomonadaceae bacterium]